MRSVNVVTVKKQVSSIKCDKSSGIENIRTQVIKDCYTARPELAVSLLNSSMNTSKVPSPWKVGTVIPLPKAGDSSKVGNWRPICLLDIHSKLTEKVVHQQLITHLLENKIISEQQFGFIPGRSTGDAIFGLCNELYKARNKGERSAVVFLDLKKAFDTVDRTILMKKLSSFNVQNEALSWLDDFLQDRQQQTRANGKVSKLQPVSKGVPQGSVIGPLLFIAYINDVTHVITNCKFFLYADDLAVVVSAADPERVRLLLQQDLDAIGKWCNQNKLTVNASKTQVLWVYSSRSIPDLTNMDLVLNNTILKRVPEFNYLGLTMDTYLSLSKQLSKQINLMRVRISQLRRLFRRTDKHVALLVYKQMVRPIVDYCSFMAGGGPAWAQRKIQTLQNNGLRACEGIIDPRGIDVDALHVRSNVTKLRVTQERQLVSLLHKLSRNPENVIIPPRILRGNDKVKLKLERAKTDIYEKSPLYRGRPLWDTLPSKVQKLVSNRKFNSGIKLTIK